MADCYVNEIAEEAVMHLTRAHRETILVSLALRECKPFKATETKNDL